MRLPNLLGRAELFVLPIQPGGSLALQSCLREIQMAVACEDRA
jgi:hypothetical protein